MRARGAGRRRQARPGRRPARDRWPTARRVQAKTQARAVPPTSARASSTLAQPAWLPIRRALASLKAGRARSRRRAAPTVLSTCQPFASRNVTTCSTPSTPPNSNHAAPPMTTIAPATSRARRRWVEREAGQRHQRPGLGEHRQTDECTTGAFASTGPRRAAERDAADGQRHGQEVESGEDPTAPAERQQQQQPRHRGLRIPASSQGRDDHEVGHELAQHQQAAARRRVVGVVDDLDGQPRQRRVLDLVVAVREADGRGRSPGSGGCRPW